MAPPSRPPFARLDQDMIYHSFSDDLSLPDDLDFWSFVKSYKGPGRPDPRGATWFQRPTGEKVSYEQVAERVEHLAAAIVEDIGLQENDVVCLFSPNAIDWAITAWAIARAGCVISPANPGYSVAELEHQLKLVNEHYRVKAIFAHPVSLSVALDTAKRIGLSSERVYLIDEVKGTAQLSVNALLRKHSSRKSLPERKKWSRGEGKQRLAIISSSSGTTGPPKAIALPHASLIANVLQFFQFFDGWYDYGNERTLAVLPFFHAYGLVGVLLRCVYSNITLVPIPKFELEPALDIISSRQITRLDVVPPMVVLFAKHPSIPKYDMSRVKSMLVGAAPLGADTIAAFQKRLPDCLIMQGYGLSECCCGATLPPWTIKDVPPASCGILMPSLSVKIVDPETGKKLGFGERGELCIKSPGNALEYLGNAKATKDTFRDDGFVYTGDEAYMDEQGYVYITDRLKELIKTKGLQVAPSELEDHLLGHDDVADACVVGIPDEYAGELPLAFVALSEGAKSQAGDAKALEQIKASIAQYVKDHKSRHKHLDGGIVVLDVIPKTPSGKLLRRVLRDRAKLERTKSKM